MIKISKEDAMAIREKLRGVHVTMTNRQSKSRARSYYVENSEYVLRFLRQLHSKDKIEHYE